MVQDPNIYTTMYIPVFGIELGTIGKCKVTLGSQPHGSDGSFHIELSAPLKSSLTSQCQSIKAWGVISALSSGQFSLSPSKLSHVMQDWLLIVTSHFQAIIRFSSLYRNVVVMMLMDGIQVTFKPAGLLLRTQASANATIVLSCH